MSEILAQKMTAHVFVLSNNLQLGFHASQTDFSQHHL